jgi:hypothetical protein
MIHHASPILKGRLIETLSTRFDSRVEIDSFDVSVFRGLEATGGGLRIYPPESVVAAGATQPLIAVKHFSFHSGLIGLFIKPMHVLAVGVKGLQIQIPPREMRQQAAERRPKHHGKIKILVNEIICDDSQLIIGTSKPDKDPKHFVLRHIELHDVGPNAPWQYDATLTNAVPRGDIHATGRFGPWQTERPGDSSVTGHYTFNHVDLNTIKGISGVLTSVGNFKGQLDKIMVEGTTNTPNFSLDTANHAMPLATEFAAIVDGTRGDTYLQHVDAKLRDSNLTARGAIINIKGHGHEIKLNMDVPAGHLQDFLDLAVKTQPPVMSGIIRTHIKLQIRPGPESVSQKLSFAGAFALRQIQFSNPKVQDKVDMLSLRARGKPQYAKPGAADVASQMNGTFSLSSGALRFSDLEYHLPGARVNLAGVYSLDGQRFDFRGKVYTQAALWQMVDSRWKSLLLWPVSPFFRGKGGGTEIPVKISGTRSAPKFGLDIGRHDHSDHDTGKSAEQ